MSNSFFLKVAAVTVLVIGFCAVLMALLPGDPRDKAPLVGGLMLGLLLIGIVVYLVFMPRLYKKKLEDKGNKSLRRYLMTDPRFQDALKSSTEKWQGEDTASQNVPREKEHKQEEQPQSTGETPDQKEEKKKSSREPPDEDDLFG
ncbi:MAG: hypothetical protein R6V10_08235 [bacterium]